MTTSPIPPPTIPFDRDLPSRWWAAPLWWSRSGRLRLDDDGDIWLAGTDETDPDADAVRLGPLERADVPSECFADLDRLQDEWRDADSRADLEAEWNHVFYSDLGC